MTDVDAAKGLAALGSEPRIRIFRFLSSVRPVEVPAGDIAAHLEMPPATLSFHLKELSFAGLLTSRRDGRQILYSAVPSAVDSLLSCLREMATA